MKFNNIYNNKETEMNYPLVNPKYVGFDEKMQLGYKYLHEENYTETIKTWIEVWNYLMDEMKKNSIKTFSEFDEMFDGSEFVSNWITDFDDCLSYVISSSHDADVLNSYGNLRIQLNEQSLYYLDKGDELSIENAKRAIAETHFIMGNINKGEELFENYLNDNPQWGWGWIGWSDQYWLCKSDSAGFKRGEELLLKALNVPGLRDIECVEERLINLYSESEEEDKLKTFMDKLKVKDKIKNKKIGRNDPCPCGSGKKYKKCCGSNI